MTTTTTTQFSSTTISSTITSLVHEFNIAWNEKDLQKLSHFIDDDIVYLNPTIKVGFVNIKGRVLNGSFRLLRFWKNFFKNFDAIQEEKQIVSIHKGADSYKVICNADNYGLRLSSELIFYFNSELLIEKIHFTRVTKFKSKENLSVFSILLKQARAKYFSN